MELSAFPFAKCNLWVDLVVEVLSFLFLSPKIYYYKVERKASQRSTNGSHVSDSMTLGVWSFLVSDVYGVVSELTAQNCTQI